MTSAWLKQSAFISSLCHQAASFAGWQMQAHFAWRALHIGAPGAHPY